jgi:hypothetical protein
MCKMLFIGTQNELQEIPLDAVNPDFYLEKISGEFLPINQTFKNQNIYFVGTSRGCSCDFGIQSNRRDPTLIEQTPPIQNFFNKFRKLSGTLDKWKKRHQEKVDNAIEAQAKYLTQTLNLIDIILNEINEGNSVEMFCVWAGDYDTTPEFSDTIDTKKIDLRENFEISEKEFVIYM